MLKYAFNWLVAKFKKPAFKSVPQIHWVNHIHDQTVSWPNGALMWANVHGFEENSDSSRDGENGWVYWVGIDTRSFGIRVADYLVRCKDKRTYNEYLTKALTDTTKFLYKMREDSRMNCRHGDDVNVEFIFRWGGESKTFDVHLGTDSYAEQK